jgi:alkylation response protein AidB-like acyl-CoA dehydrogenase
VVIEAPGTSARDETAAIPSRSSLLDIARRLEPAIREHERAMEEERTLPAVLVDALYESGVFRTFTPRELGGLEVDPVEWLDMVEELSRVNGSVGWLAMINAGGTRLRPEVMRRLLAEKGRWINASNLGRIGGTARRVEGGYRISGRWPFSSGAPHSLFMSGQSYVSDEQGEPVIDPVSGGPRVIYATWPAEDGRILDTWDGLGLRGTGSHDIVAEDVLVPDAMVGAGPGERRYPGPLYMAALLLLAVGGVGLGFGGGGLVAFMELAVRAR